MESSDYDQRMDAENLRSVHIARTGTQTFRVTNDRGAIIDIGEGQNVDFTPVELLLAAIGGCNAVGVDALTKRAEPEVFEVSVHGFKTKAEDGGTQIEDIEVGFTVRFGNDEMGQKMTERLSGAIERTHTTLCTVGRTVEAGQPIKVGLRDV